MFARDYISFISYCSLMSSFSKLIVFVCCCFILKTSVWSCSWVGPFQDFLRIVLVFLLRQYFIICMHCRGMQGFARDHSLHNPSCIFFQGIEAVRCFYGSFLLSALGNSQIAFERRLIPWDDSSLCARNSGPVVLSFSPFFC